MSNDARAHLAHSCTGNCNQGRSCTCYTGPERRIPLDSKALRRVLAGLICFWVVLVFGVPALLNVLMARAS